MRITINGETLTKVKKGTTITERRDEELDTGLIVALNTQSEEYEPMSQVAIYITSDITPDVYFVVSQDESILIKKDNPKIYQHTISIIEPTKLLEKIIVDGIAFTQPIDSATKRYTMSDVLERLADITPLDTTAKHATTRLFKIDPDLITAWSSISAPEFYFKGMNAMQVLTEIFRYQNAFPRIRTFDAGIPVVTADYLNEITALIADPNRINRAKTNSDEYFVGKLDITLENAITDQVETFPPEPNLTVMTTPSFVMNTEELEIKTPNPIYAIKKIIMVCKYANKALQSQTETMAYREIDLTSFVYEEEAFNLLDLTDKYTALVYKKGDSVIKNFGVAFPQLFGLFVTNNFVNILDYAQDRTITMPDYTTRTYAICNWNSGDRPFESPASLGGDAIRGYYGFRIYYYPFVTARINIIKQNAGNQKNYTLLTNQASPALSVTRAADNAQGVIDRLGNGDLIYESAQQRWSDRLKVGQKAADGYIVTTVESQLQEDFYRYKASLSRNFNRISQFVGVDREYRQFAIRYNQFIERNLIYNQYITLDTATALTGLMVRDNSFRDLLRYMFTSSYATYDDYTIDGAIISTYDGVNSDAIGHFLMSVAKGSHRNSNIFYMKFQSNVVAYQYPDSGLEKKTAVTLEKLITSLRNRYYTYNNDANANDLLNGTLEKLTLKLVDNDFIKSIDDLVIQVSTVSAMRSHYDAIKTVYPYGLFYKITTESFTDANGLSWTYVLKNDHWSVLEMGFRAEEVLNELLYSMNYEADNQIYDEPAMTSHPKYLSGHYPAIRHQREIYNNGQQNNFTKYFKTDYAKVTVSNLIIEKDPSEALALTYQLHYLPGTADIIVGPTLAEKSPYNIIRSTLTVNSRRLHLYRSTNYYEQGATTVLGTRHGTSGEPFLDITVTALTVGFTVACPNGFPTDYNSWAVGDYNGNLYFAVNRNRSTETIPTTIYFNYRDRL